MCSDTPSFNKVLLYEPGKTGHRPVILRYLVQHLPDFGWQPVVCDDQKYSRLSSSDLDALDLIAKANGCSLVHILTIDGCARRWVFPRKILKSERLPLIGSYYLFSNLTNFRGFIWLWILWLGYFDRLLISDPYIPKRFVLPELVGRVSYVPDPWSKKEFIFHSKYDARQKLNLPEKDLLVLVFGEISQRKGIQRILSALRIISCSTLKIIFAGRVASDATDDIEAFYSDKKHSNKIILINRFIEEKEVAMLFCAADAVLSDYPKNFKVSSGAFTRALVAKSIPIVPDHGVLSEWVKQNRFGLTYLSESPVHLAAVLDELPLKIKIKDSLFCIENCEIESDSREASNYAKNVTIGYENALLSRTSISTTYV
jgi:glycosyltransferase involved in cell wall biosynthesis